MTTQDMLDKFEEIKRLSIDVWNEARHIEDDDIAEGEIKSLATRIRTICENVEMDVRIEKRLNG